MSGEIAGAIRQVRGVTADPVRVIRECQFIGKVNAGVTMPWELSGMSEEGFHKAL